MQPLIESQVNNTRLVSNDYNDNDDDDAHRNAQIVCVPVGTQLTIKWQTYDSSSLSLFSLLSVNLTLHPIQPVISTRWMVRAYVSN